MAHSDVVCSTDLTTPDGFGYRVRTTAYRTPPTTYAVTIYCAFSGGSYYGDPLNYEWDIRHVETAKLIHHWLVSSLVLGDKAALDAIASVERSRAKWEESTDGN